MTPQQRQSALRNILYRQQYNRRPYVVAKHKEYNAANWQRQKEVKLQEQLLIIHNISSMGLLG